MLGLRDVNTGGDTKCKDFLTQDEKKQNDEISKMLKDKSGQEPTNLDGSTPRERHVLPGRYGNEERDSAAPPAVDDR